MGRVTGVNSICAPKAQILKCISQSLYKISSGVQNMFKMLHMEKREEKEN